MDISGKTAFVTGGSGDIGGAIALPLDQRDPAGVEAAVDRVLGHCGLLDIPAGMR